MSRARTTAGRLLDAVRAIVRADPAQVETTVRRLGASRRYLAPIAWAAGALVLVLRGVGLLLTNWRLALIELVPSLWVWLAMWDLKVHGLRTPSVHDITFGQVVATLGATIGLSTLAFCCNAVFGFAISQDPPRIRPALRGARAHLRWLATAGVVAGCLLGVALMLIPELGTAQIRLLAALGLYSAMLTCLVLIPARVLGVAHEHLGPRQQVGAWIAGGALSAVAMTPGFVLDRIGIVLLGTPHLHLVGLLVLSAGTTLYAAGVAAVKAVKLSMKLTSLPEDADPLASHPV